MKRIVLGSITVFILTIAVVSADTIYVSSSTSSIDKFDSNGNRTTFVTTPYIPHGLAFDKNGYLYAVLPGGGSTTSIVKYDSTGNQVTFASGIVDSLGCLAFDSKGFLYSNNCKAPDENPMILKFDSNGNPSVFTSGYNDVFYYPYAIAFDESDCLYVGQQSNFIWKFDSSGSFVKSLSPSGTYYGLAFDKNGYLYASNEVAGRIERFAPDGSFDGTFASGLNSPRSLAFDSSGNLYVANYGSSTIDKFDPSGNRSLFASGISTNYIAVEAPEPASLLLLGLGSLLIRKR